MEKLNDNFQIALAWLFKTEGGYVNDPDDPGGATRYGISLRYLKTKGKLGDINGDGIIDVDDIEVLDKPQAALFYLTDFWHTCQCDELPLPLAIIVFDQAVNTGVGTASRCLQAHVHAKVDGVIGPVTLAAVATHFYRNPTWFIASYLGKRATYYHDITLANSSLSKFLKGWFNRLFELQQFIVENA